MFRVFHIKRLFRNAVIFLLILGFAGLAAVKLRYPLAYSELIRDSAARHGLEPAFVYAVIHAESKFKADAVSPKDARGLMQLTRGTADWVAEKMSLRDYRYEDIFQAPLNIEIGCWYLSYLLNRYGGSRELALAAYNAGGGNVDKWLKDQGYSKDGYRLSHIPFEETRNFVKRVDGNYKIYSLFLKLRRG